MRQLKKYNLIWSPEGKVIASYVIAPNGKAAIRLAPYPYRHYLGEIYAIEIHRIPEDIPEKD